MEDKLEHHAQVDAANEPDTAATPEQKPWVKSHGEWKPLGRFEQMEYQKTLGKKSFGQKSFDKPSPRG